MFSPRDMSNNPCGALQADDVNNAIEVQQRSSADSVNMSQMPYIEAANSMDGVEGVANTALSALERKRPANINDLLVQS